MVFSYFGALFAKICLAQTAFICECVRQEEKDSFNLCFEQLIVMLYMINDFDNFEVLAV